MPTTLDDLLDLIFKLWLTTDDPDAKRAKRARADLEAAWGRLWAVVYRLVSVHHGRDTADDITTEVVMRVKDAIAAGKGLRGAFVWVVLRNRATDAF